MTSATQVKDIMTSDVVTIGPETGILEVAKIFTEKKFNGLPVVDADRRLIGLVTEYNLIAAESMLHLPTLEKISKNATSPLSDLEFLTEQVKKTTALKVQDIMEKSPMTIQYDASFEEALELLHQHHRVNPIPVVDKNHTLVGVLSRYDLLKLLKLFGHT